MNIEKHLLVMSAAALLTLPLAGTANATPKVFGLLSAGAVEDEKDFESEAFEVELGVKGAYELEGAKAVYELLVDVSDAVNAEEDTDGEDEIHVRQASVAFPTRYGSFIIAPRAVSGQFRNIYGGLRKFEYNEPHADTPASGGKIFEQPDEGQNVLAYVSPNWSGLQLIGASLQVDEDNGEDHDVVAVRAVYWGDNWNIGIGRVNVDQAAGPPFATEDYNRDSIGFAYNIANVELGGVYEKNRDRFLGDDSDVLGLAARVKFGQGWSTSLGYFDKDYDDDSTGTDDNLIVLNLKKQFHEKVELWAEAGQYEEADDNLALGVNVSF
ncbi:porin [Marinobacterium aestuariivivens]|uniref:Porin n=1 Tax=Marinobacterium aestuariivivens TaxID=1698799 RepID=A0ABW2AAW1_9GAMM